MRVIRDFHLHSLYSDGLFTPQMLLTTAAELNVTEVAITDHNTVAGLPEGLEVAQELGLTLVPGVEITSTLDHKEIHVLGYDLNLNSLENSLLETYMKKIKEADERWAIDVAQISREQPILVNLGKGTQRELFIEDVELSRFSQSTKSSHFHFGILVKEKLELIIPEFTAVPARHVFYFLFWRRAPEYIERYAHVFAKYGITNRRYWHVSRKDFPFASVQEVVEMLIRVDAIPVIAHPAEMHVTQPELLDMVQMGVKGIEVYTAKHDENQVKLYETLATKYGLLKTSGTDYHDPHHRNQVQIGRDRYGHPLYQGITAEDMKKFKRAKSTHL